MRGAAPSQDVEVRVTEEKGFDPRAYWEQRLSEEYSLHGVGYASLGLRYNRWMYRIRRRVFRRTMRRFLRDRSSMRVLDVGCGTGFYVDQWRELGIGQIAGLDLTETAWPQGGRAASGQPVPRVVDPADARRRVRDRLPQADVLAMNGPVDSTSRVMAAWWRRLMGVARRGDRAANIAGAMLFPVELALTRVMRESPTTEIMVCRRPAAEVFRNARG